MTFCVRAGAIVFSGLALIGMAMTPAEAQKRQSGPRGIEAAVINRANVPLLNLFVTAIDSAEWGEDRLGADTVRAGGRFGFSMEASRQCRYDVRAVFEGGREDIRTGVDLCQRPQITVDSRTQPSLENLPRQGPVVFYIVRNRTAAMMMTLKLIDSDGEESEDVLGSTTVAAGASFVGRFKREDGCDYSFAATFKDVDDRALPTRDLCARREVVFEDSGSRPQTDATQANRTPGTDGATIEVNIINRATLAIQVLNVRRARANDWGQDRLGRDVIATRSSFTLRLPSGGNCSYDIRVAYDNNREEIRSGVNLCETRELTFEGPAAVAGRGQPKGAAPSTAPSGTRQSSQVTILNEGTRTIEALFISSSREQSWGEDILGTARVIAGARYETRVERDDQCNFDIRVVYEGGREERRMRQNICERREIALGGPNARRIDGGGPQSGRRVALNNDGRGDVREFYLTPTSDTHWGDDRLGSETMPRGFVLDVRLPAESGCRWDIKLVYANNQSVERRNQDLCATQEMNVGQRGRPGAVASTGTGFYVSGTGHIMTNHHVIDGCTTVAIARPGGRVPVRVVASDEGIDLAVLKEDVAGSPGIPLRSRTASAIRAGERVVLVGYPARSQLGGVNVTEGLLSGLRGPLGDRSRFQYSAPTQPGNSGGPVMDESGLVVGVVVSQIDKISNERTAQNINFGITLDMVRSFLEQHGVTPTEEAPGAALRASDILQARDASVVPLDCLE
jgi:hypothetical protein